MVTIRSVAGLADRYRCSWFTKPGTSSSCRESPCNGVCGYEWEIEFEPGHDLSPINVHLESSARRSAHHFVLSVRPRSVGRFVLAPGAAGRLVESQTRRLFRR